MTSIALIGTCDSKLQELLYLRQQILISGYQKVLLIDCGRESVIDDKINISQADVLKYSDDKPRLSDLPRGDVIKHMIKCTSACVKSLYDASKIDAIVSAGGSGGTSLAAAVMREALPIGFPKLIVSTVASGDTTPLVGECDITMMYSVVDIAGSNPLLQSIFSNAAGAISGMARAHHWRKSIARDGENKSKKRVGITMFGVTTPCVDMVRQYLEDYHDYEIYVFHATGTGGRAMERLIREGKLDAVLDLTTTEICDFLMGGNMSAGPDRLEAAARMGIPYVVSVGATDMVNFGPRDTVPQNYKGRKFFEHNPTVTLMRTTPAECKSIGEFIVEKLKKYAINPEKIKMIFPLKGVSMLSTKNQVFEDHEADEAIFRSIREGLENTNVEILDKNEDINSNNFAMFIAEKLVEMIGQEYRVSTQASSKT